MGVGGEAVIEMAEIEKITFTLESIPEAISALLEQCAKLAESHAPVAQCMSVEPVVQVCAAIAADTRALKPAVCDE